MTMMCQTSRSILKDDNMRGVHEEKEKEEIKRKVNYNNNRFGEVLKEGTICMQDQFEEWVECYIVISERGITRTTQQRITSREGEDPLDIIMTFSCPDQIGIVMLPDNARRSRESKLFPFAVRKKIDQNSQLLKIEKGASVIQRGMHNDEVIFATSDGREMWEWASCIQWLGTKPKEEKIQLFIEASTVNNHNEYYEDAELLQDALLLMFTYKNLPKNPIRFEDLARINLEQRHNVLQYINYPDNVISQADESDSSHLDEDDENSDSDDKCSYYEGSDDIVLKDKIHIRENHAHTFGLFAYITLVGACVHVNEKCFELVLSSNLYDVSSQVTWKGNSPLSMLCEGDYNPSRHYMVQALWKLGYPKLEGHFADYANDKAFSIFVAKPPNLWNVRSLVGGPVHPDDQKLCRHLRDEGDGGEANRNLSNQLIEASKMESIEFEAEHKKKITAMIIPESVIDWGRSMLTKLNLKSNGIFELPEELYYFTNLKHLDLSCNCLFSLSHKLGNMSKLTYFNIECNLIEELPYTIEKLERITEFKCSLNPITTPPSAVWARGIANVRDFFRDMRESGTEINVDLRVLVLGLSEAGKTSFINGMINPNATALTRVGDRTVGIEKRTWVMERNKNNRPVNLLIYDFAGQEEYYITHNLFLGSKALYIIAFDLSRYEPKLIDRQIMLWWNSIQNRVCDVKSNDSKTPKVILVGTHADMVDDAQSIADDILESLREHFRLRMRDLDDRLKILELELDDLDPRRTAELCDDKIAAKQKIDEYGMLSAYSKSQILSRENAIKKIRHEQQCTIALPSVIQAVSSKDLRNFDALQDQILSSLADVGPSGKYFPHLDVPLPGSWFQVRRFVRQQSTQKGCECMKLPKYFKLLRDELDINIEVGQRATKFCHDLGDVLYFEKEDLIFLQPSFLIDIFKYVIRHDHKESTFWTNKMLRRNITEDQFNKGKELLLQKGELEQWLLEVLWSRLYDDLAEASIMNNLVQLLETFDIGTSIERKGKKILSIPEFQPKTLAMNWTDKNVGDYEVQRWISVEQKLPHGILKRIQTRICKKVFKRSGAKEFNLAQNEIYVMDKNLSELYCKSGRRTKECPGFGTSEGIRLYIRGANKNHVLSLLSKVYDCIEDTLNDYPGLVFDHYIVHATTNGSSFIKLEEVQAMQAAGESKIHGYIQILSNTINVVDAQNILCPHKHNSMSKAEVILNINDILPLPLDKMMFSWSANFKLK